MSLATNNNKPLKVLMVIPGVPGGTSFIFAKRQGQSLQSEGVDVQFYFLASRTSIRGLLHALKEFKNKIREFAPDIIHAQYGTVTALFCTMSTTLPIVITFQGSDLNQTSADGWLKDKLGRLFSHIAVLRAKAIICVSKALVQQLKWGSKKATIIPNGINIDNFEVQPKLIARRRLGWSETRPVVIFNANNPHIKRLDLAQQTLKLVAEKIPAIHLEVLTGVIEYVKMPLMLNAADCLLICSDSEGSPMMVKEAMACNLPVVGVNVGDVVERIGLVNNCVVTKKEPHALADALVQIISNGNRSNGRETLLKQGLDEKSIALLVISVYEKIIGDA